MHKFDYVVASSEQQVADAQRLRWVVYVEEEGMACLASNEARLTRRLVDAGDRLEATTHLLVYARGEAVGGVRMTEVRTSSHAGADDCPDAPFAIRGLPADARVAVIERFCVRKPFRGTGVTAALYEGLGIESRRRGITHWVAFANAQTDCPLEATIVYQVAAFQGLVSDQVRAHDLHFPCPTSPCSRHAYTAQQREQGLLGWHDKMTLPRTLSLFAKRMGGTYVGPPVYDPTFGVFVMPLVARPPAAPSPPLARN